MHLIKNHSTEQMHWFVFDFNSKLNMVLQTRLLYLIITWIQTHQFMEHFHCHDAICMRQWISISIIIIMSRSVIITPFITKIFFNSKRKWKKINKKKTKIKIKNKRNETKTNKKQIDIISNTLWEGIDEMITNTTICSNTNIEMKIKNW